MNRAERIDGTAAAGLYLFAFTLAFWPLADLVLNIFPPRPGNVQWRYGAIGLLSSYLHTPLLGTLVAAATAWLQGHRRVLRGLSVLYMLAALALLCAMAVFALDLLQVRELRAAEALPAVTLGGMVAEAKLFTTALVLGLLGWGGMRSADGMRTHRGTPASSPGVVATSSSRGG